MAAEKAKSIAVAVDGSVSGWEAMQRAINMARLLTLPLDVLHVIQLRKAGYFAFIDRHLQEDQQVYAKTCWRKRSSGPGKKAWKPAPICWRGKRTLPGPSSIIWIRPEA